jgi:hypothetical protein
LNYTEKMVQIQYRTENSSQLINQSIIVSLPLHTPEPSPGFLYLRTLICAAGFSSDLVKAHVEKECARTPE